jgi:hypothetical protein
MTDWTTKLFFTTLKGLVETKAGSLSADTTENVSFLTEAYYSDLDSSTAFLKLAGRAGGQIAYGGTVSGDDLTLNSTSHATKGDVLIQSNGGNVGIGALPSYKLDVQTSGGDFVARFFNDGNSAAYGGLLVQCGQDDGLGTTNYLYCYDGDGTNVGYIRNTNGTFALADSSDERLKIDIAPTKISGLETINKIKPIEFHRKKGGSNSHLIPCGLSAQNVQLAYPDAVSENNEGFLAVSRDVLVPILIKAVNELSEKNNELQKRIEQLEKKLKTDDIAKISLRQGY